MLFSHSGGKKKAAKQTNKPNNYKKNLQKQWTISHLTSVLYSQVPTELRDNKSGGLRDDVQQLSKGEKCEPLNSLFMKD